MFQIKADENTLIATNFETYYQRQMVTVSILILHSYVIATRLHATIFLVFSEQELEGTQLSTYPVVPHRTRAKDMVQILPSPAKPISSLCTIGGVQLSRELHQAMPHDFLDRPVFLGIIEITGYQPVSYTHLTLPTNREV